MLGTYNKMAAPFVWAAIAACVTVGDEERLSFPPPAPGLPVVLGGRRMESLAGGPAVGSGGTLGDSQAPASERQRRVNVLSASLRSRLGPYEPVLSALQAALVWENPARSAIGWVGAHAAFGCVAWQRG